MVKGIRRVKLNEMRFLYVLYYSKLAKKLIKSVQYKINNRC